MEFFDWTDEQWDRYNSAKVTIPLPHYEMLIQAVELLSSGSRLSKAERESWEQKLQQIYQPEYDRALKEINFD